MFGHALLGVIVGSASAVSAWVILDVSVLAALGVYVVAGGATVAASAIAVTRIRDVRRSAPRGRARRGADRVIPLRSPPGR